MKTSQNRHSVLPVILDEVDYQLLGSYQRDFPMCNRPFARIAEEVDLSEDDVIERLNRLYQQGVISRIGPVIRPKRVGYSTLAALSVPEQVLNEVADLVNSYQEVNHNYEREHEFNLWFVVTAFNRQRVNDVLEEIHQKTGLQLLDLPMEESYHIDLGFPLWC